MDGVNKLYHDFFKVFTEVHSTTSGTEVQRRANEKCLMCRMCDITGWGGAGKNVRKCEKGEGGGGGVLEISPKSVISYLNSPLSV